MVVLLLLLQWGGETVRAGLRFERGAIAAGELWRLGSAHFVHLGWNHALLNGAGVLLCCLLAPERFDRGLWRRLACLALAVGLGLWWLSPQVPDYVGLSGVLYGMFVLCLLPQGLRGDRSAWLALACIFAWMLWQWLVAPAASEEKMIGGKIISIAHVYGFCLGLAGVGLAWLGRRWRTAVRRHPQS
ncbi:rhombosortase [Kerstersia similis]|uniref:rhombosortase n=1 Tax=Kerstersia similis TaxID=206505 RepID=UPI0039EFFA3E